ncbi:hypothetical protein GIV49_17970 [Pseudomonas syringae]|uniref:hypothetical protein n=1 Tax=Pseudomonas syringae TaxID=317 RepID=UPI001F1E8ED5|nr:hypothetical protein [Pseudomonas syringae]MCF5651433.1 hypothetical protein [Pseudomonas syringae]
MDIDFEGRVWNDAAHVFGERLQNLVEEGIASFKRQPGLDEPTRMYVSKIGRTGFEALDRAMHAIGSFERSRDGAGFIVVRSRLRMHLKRHLQWQLMQSMGTADEVAEDYFAGDLGL